MPEDDRRGYQPSGPNEGVDTVNSLETEFTTTQDTAGATASVGYHQRHQNQRLRNKRSLPQAARASDPLLGNSTAMESNLVTDSGQVVGYIQGYGAVTSDPGLSASLIRGKFNNDFTNR